MAPPRPKSASRIEVWRHEVSACVPPSPPPKPPSFWRKIVGGRKSKGSDASSAVVSREGVDSEESVRTEMYSCAGSGRKGEEDGREGSSMDLERGSDGGIGGALRARAERLDRAARLLESSGGKGEVAK